MHARQLAYFVAACQWPNHAIAARELGVSSSALSASLNQLSNQLGFALFRRGPSGAYPTADARWFYQEFEQILQILEMAPAHMADSAQGELCSIRIRSPLHFSIGMIRKAASLAIRASRRSFPNVLFELALVNHGSIPATAVHDPSMRARLVDHVEIDYSDPATDAGAIKVLDDAWVCVSNLGNEPFRSGDPISLAQLQSLPITVPVMHPRLLEQIDDEMAQRGLRPLARSALDPADIPEFCANGAIVCLLLPRSMVSMRIDATQVSIHRLSDGPSARLIVRVRNGEAAALAFVAQLAHALEAPESGQIYRPGITLKQLRYFDAVFSHRKIGLAARRLHVAQPALSSQLAILERRLGVRLFDRLPSGIGIRPEANRLAVLASAVLTQIDALASALPTANSEQRTDHRPSRHRPTLCIGLSAELDGMSAMARALCATLLAWERLPDSPKVQILQQPIASRDFHLRGVALDFVIGYRAPGWRRRPAFASSTVHAENLPQDDPFQLAAADPLVLVSDPSLMGIDPGEIALARIASLQVAMSASGTSVRETITAAASLARVRIEPHFVIDSDAAIQVLVRTAPVGAIVPASIARAWCEAAPLQCNRIVEPGLDLVLSIMHDPGRDLTEPALAFISLLRQTIESKR